LIQETTMSAEQPAERCEQAERCDVLVIGGGPAGSVAAALLAERGRDVVLLEKATHPRFHIGESLLPRNTAIFDRLGVRAQVAAMGVFKPGAEFVSDTTGGSVHFAFAQGLDQEYTNSWQVRRAEFDTMLFRTAAGRGARTAENTRVTDVQFAADGADNGAAALVTAIGPDGAARHYAPRFVLDASGRDTLLAGKLRTKRANKRNNTAALFAHFTGVERRVGELAGYISVHLVEDGWFWLIPLLGEVMSVGFVGDLAAFKARAGSPHDLFMRRIADSPTVSARMRDAELASEVVSTGNFSYDAASAWGEGYMMIGDAFAFLDPVFSSGVLLAMTAGERGADVADAWLDDPARGRALARRVERDMRTAMARISWLIYRINTPALRLLFMAPRNTLRMRDGLVSLLAGNLRGNWRMVLPVLAFKAVYFVVALALRLGLPTGTRRPQPQPQS
jgi:flavin-dependent dehydrogenase